MKPTKKIVYLPVEKASAYTDAIVSNNREDFYTHALQQEGYFFTPEQLNEYTANVIKQALKTAAENAEGTTKIKIECTTEELEKGYSTTGELAVVVSKQSITNTFEETFKKFEV